ncbi:MAG TPA: SemiSWEET transporter [Cyclobacteriaceae bacterium]|nr:SemiSWEET transporter [Cyclobacteriaceae bacterium]
MDLVQMIGLTAGMLTTVSFLPQVIKTWKSKSASDLSLLMFSMFCTGILMWLIYGILINDLPIILSNIVTLSLAGTILFFKFRFK